MLDRVLITAKGKINFAGLATFQTKNLYLHF